MLTTKFQSAVAHELFSDRLEQPPKTWGLSQGFKALSRMSSSPTGTPTRELRRALGFQSAVAHELFSDVNVEEKQERVVGFQSAVAHELFSDQMMEELWNVEIEKSFKALSRMSSSPTVRLARAWHGCLFVSKRCRA